MSDFGTNILPGQLGAVNFSTSKIIEDGDLSADVDSGAYDIRQFPCVAVHIEFTGSPTGTFYIQGSNVPSAASTNWVTIPVVDGTGVVTLSASGSAGSYLANLFNLGFASLRVIYDFTSGTGDVNVWLSMKGA